MIRRQHKAIAAGILGLGLAVLALPATSGWAQDDDPPELAPITVSDEFVADEEGESSEVEPEFLPPPADPAPATPAAGSVTSEGEAVEFSVDDITQLVALPDGTRRESDEDPTNPSNMFATEEKIKEMLGDKPRYIYFPVGADPMIIPWVRDEILAQEKIDDAKAAAKVRDYDKAIALLDEVTQKFSQTDAAKKVPELRTDYVAAKRRVETGTDEGNKIIVDEKSKLPKWVEENTDGVIIADEPMLIVGSDWLRVGDTVPLYSSVRVKSIAPGEVVYVYQDNEFAVKVNGSF